jgi:DNA-binding transcriptional LysR family regulator
MSVIGPPLAHPWSAAPEPICFDSQINPRQILAPTNSGPDKFWPRQILDGGLPLLHPARMTYLLMKAAISGLLIALASEVARRYAGLGALIAFLPLVSLLGMVWLWRDTHDPARLADHAEATLWYVCPSLPMFVLIPLMLRAGFGFYPTLAAGCTLTFVLYLLTMWIGSRMGLAL